MKFQYTFRWIVCCLEHLKHMVRLEENILAHGVLELIRRSPKRYEGFDEGDPEKHERNNEESIRYLRVQR